MRIQELQTMRDQGLTARRDDVEAVAVAAYTALSGTTHEDYLDQYESASR